MSKGTGAKPCASGQRHQQIEQFIAKVQQPSQSARKGPSKAFRAVVATFSTAAVSTVILYVRSLTPEPHTLPEWVTLSSPAVTTVTNAIVLGLCVAVAIQMEYVSYRFLGKRCKDSLQVLMNDPNLGADEREEVRRLYVSLSTALTNTEAAMLGTLLKWLVGLWGRVFSDDKSFEAKGHDRSDKEEVEIGRPPDDVNLDS